MAKDVYEIIFTTTCGVVVVTAVTIAAFAIADEVDYLICKNDDQTIEQYKGYVDIRDDHAIVTGVDGTKTIVAGVDCWSSDDSVTPSETTTDYEQGVKIQSGDPGVCVSWDVNDCTDS